MRRYLLLITGLLLAACANGAPETAVTSEPSATAVAAPTMAAAPELPATVAPAPTTAAAPALPVGGNADGGGGNADVTFVRAVRQGEAWTFHVTVAHPDTGWEDYVDGWDVVLPDGTVLKTDPESPFTRLLLHPHETEQPFTRSQSGLAIPASVSQVRVRAHDLVDGFGGREVVVDLQSESGERFSVEP